MRRCNTGSSSELGVLTLNDSKVHKQKNILSNESGRKKSCEIWRTHLKKTKKTKKKRQSGSLEAKSKGMRCGGLTPVCKQHINDATKRSANCVLHYHMNMNA